MVEDVLASGEKDKDADSIERKHWSGHVDSSPGSPASCSDHSNLLIPSLVVLVSTPLCCLQNVIAVLYLNVPSFYRFSCCNILHLTRS